MISGNTFAGPFSIIGADLILFILLSRLTGLASM
jgi:hypothetical protein